jgi:branched-chain amino acid transport system substrate-binding protein
MNLKLFVLILAFFTIDGGFALSFAENIRIGALNDLSGATADIGRDYAMGIVEAVRFVNDEGGVNGRRIELHQYDYGYRVPEVQAKYKHLKRIGVVAVLGWHIVDTDALVAVSAGDKLPYLSATYAPDLANPKIFPYQLFAGSDDSSNARAALTAWFDDIWPQKEDYGNRRPRVQFAYMFASQEVRVHIKAVKDQAELFGFNIGPDLNVSLFATDMHRQIQNIQGFQPDFVWHGNTSLSVAATLRAAADSDLAADHVVHSWAFDENLIKLAGEAAEGVMGASVGAYYAEDTPLMDVIKLYGKRYHPGVPAGKRSIRTTQAWANVLALREALIRADSTGILTGEQVLKKGFETFDGFDVGLRVSPLTYTPADHRASGQVNIYRIEKRKFKFMTKIDLKGRWPDKWEKDWLGW